MSFKVECVDMALLDRDFFVIPKNEIREAKGIWTIAGGNMAYSRKQVDKAVLQ